MCDNNGTPMKWRKHLVLVTWRLREKQNLLESIHRYCFINFSVCMNDIKAEIVNAPGEYTFIIKLVYQNEFYKLPNFLVKSIEDLSGISRKFETINAQLFSEIWYCKNRTNSCETIFGRLLIDNTELFPSICPISIDMVWDSSARSIEKYPDMGCPFVSIHRRNWNAEPQFETVVSYRHDFEKMTGAAQKVVRHISAYTSEIRHFAEYIFSCGCNHLSIEFSYIDGVLNFIDWDSDNDLRVLI